MAGRSVQRRRNVVALHYRVAILARRDGRAQHEIKAATGLTVTKVAILARRDGRAQRYATERLRRGYDSCDPRPARWPGAAVVGSAMFEQAPRLLRSSPGAMAGRSPSSPGGGAMPANCCDPRPARWPGAADQCCECKQDLPTVAILARRDGRAQRGAD